MNNQALGNWRAKLAVAALILAACSGKGGAGAGSGGAQGTGGAGTGGSPGTGGGGSGGVTSGDGSGGANSGGAATANGGSLGLGGRASGGSPGTGGGSSGVTSRGGAGGSSSGTLTSSTGTGGGSSGGTTSAAGGKATGGAATGGRATGGTASGGQAATGGQAGTGSQVDGGASSGCGKPGAVTGAKTGQTITVAGQARTYVLSVPTDYTGNTPLALVFAWHGANISGSLARSLFNLESKSSGAAIFVYPDGLPMSGGMTGWDLATGSADFQFFEDLLAYITSSYCIDPNRIFSTGHSMGAMMTNTLGCTYGDVLRAIAPASGTPPGGGRATCTGKVGALVAHGENDPTVNFSSGEASRDFWIKQNGCTTETKTWAPEPACVEYQGCQPDLPVVWCVHDEGHAWPGLGRDCNRDAGVCFDGGSAIWAFFSSFQ